MKKLLLFLLCPLHVLLAAPALQSAINAVTAMGGKDVEEVAPGTPMRLVVEVENVGDQPSPECTLFVRFAFAEPLNRQPGSLLWQSEEVALPSLQPGTKHTVSLTKVHMWPTLFDFIRDDWAMRQYEAILKEKGNEYLSGTMHISFTASYYEGPSREIPVKFGSADEKGDPLLRPKPKKL